MTVATTASYTTQAGNGLTTAFTYAFTIPGVSADDQTNVRVTITNTLVVPNVTTTVAPSAYSITGIGGTGGVVTYPLAGSPLPVGWTITIARNLPLTQPLLLPNMSGYYPKEIEGEFDRLLMQLQQIADQIVFSAGTTIISPSVTVANYAALRALYASLAPIPNGTQTYVIGDVIGQGGYFEYDSGDSTSADNGGTIIVDAFARRWKRIYNSEAIASWWGAVQDGTGDDSAAIQAMIDTISAASYPYDRTGIVGNSRIAASLQMSPTSTNPIKLKGVRGGLGNGVSRLTCAAVFTGTVGLLVNGQTIGDNAAIANWGIEDLQIVGETATTCAYGLIIGTSGKDLIGVQKNRIVNVHVNNFAVCWLVQNSRLLSFENCSGWADQVTNGVALQVTLSSGAGTGDMDWKSCQFVGPATTGKSVVLGHSQNGGEIFALQFTACQFYGGARTLSLELLASGALLDDLWFDKCQFHPTGAGYTRDRVVRQFVNGTASSDVMFTNCFFRATDVGYFMVNSIVGSTAAIDDWSFIGCFFANALSQPVVLDRDKNLVFANNRFIECAASGGMVRLTNTTGFSATGNVLEELLGSADYFIYAASSVSGGVMRGNYAPQATIAPVWDASGTVDMDVWRPEAFGAKGDGTTSDNAAWDKIVALGITVRCRSTANYFITAGKTVVSGTKIFGEGCTFTCKVGAGGFASVDFATRGTLASTLFLMNTREDVQFRDFTVKQSDATQVVLYPIWQSAGFATSQLLISNVRFDGLCPSGGIAINSIGAGAYLIDNLQVKGGTFSQGMGYWSAGTPQPTIIGFDDSQVGGAGSKRGIIRGLKVNGFAFTGTALTDYGPQTDAITISKTNVEAPVIEGCVIDGVGEGIDCAGFGGSGAIGTIRNSGNFGFCYKNGASGNSYQVDLIDGAVNSGICISGATPANDTKENVIRVGEIRNVGTTGSATDRAGVKIFASGGLGYSKNNTVIIDRVVGDGTHLDWVVYSGVTANETGNVVRIGQASGYASGYGNSNLSLANVQYVRVEHTEKLGTRLTLSGDQTLTTGVTATIAFDTVVFDIGSEAVTASNKITGKYPGTYLCNVRWRLSGPSATPNVETRILNGAAQALEQEVWNSTDEQSFGATCLVYIPAANAGMGSADIKATVSVTSAGTLKVMATPEATYLEVVKL